jgi:hypothetical protein
MPEGESPRNPQKGIWNLCQKPRAARLYGVLIYETAILDSYGRKVNRRVE